MGEWDPHFENPEDLTADQPAQFTKSEVQTSTQVLKTLNIGFELFQNIFSFMTQSRKFAVSASSKASIA